MVELAVVDWQSMGALLAAGPARAAVQLEVAPSTAAAAAAAAPASIFPVFNPLAELEASTRIGALAEVVVGVLLVQIQVLLALITPSRWGMVAAAAAVAAAQQAELEETAAILAAVPGVAARGLALVEPVEQADVEKSGFGRGEMTEEVGTLIAWTLTPWRMDGKRGWELQPIILIQKQTPFFSDKPEDYIAELERMHDDPMLERGTFWTCIGQFKDGLDYDWDVEGLVDEKSHSGNHHRPSR